MRNVGDRLGHLRQPTLSTAILRRRTDFANFLQISQIRTPSKSLSNPQEISTLGQGHSGRQCDPNWLVVDAGAPPSGSV